MNVLTAFDLFNPNKVLSHKGILKERYIICGSWKNLGEKAVHSVSVADFEDFESDPGNDYHVVKHLHKVLSEADAIIAHYGDKFDIKFFNTRAIFHGLDPLPDIIQIDTYKIAKSKFLFNSNRLDYLAHYLGVGSKLNTSESLWHKCMNGDSAAVAKMVKYNQRDVNILERVYKKLRPYAPVKVNYQLFSTKDQDACKKCGSTNIQYRGYAYKQTHKYPKWQCKDCGGWTTSPKSVKEIIL